jgi:hypothetical protein
MRLMPAMQIEATANIPQGRFLALNSKFKAFVAGFGCVAGDTLIITDCGIVPMRDITHSMRVLSWSEMNNRFEFALNGGSFPKGVDYLHRVSTLQGVFVAAGFHRMLSCHGKYQRVDALHVGQTVSAFSGTLPVTISVSIPLASHGDDQHLTQTTVDSMVRYANEARQYGQQFLKDQDTDQCEIQPPTDAQVYNQLIEDEGGQQVREQGRNRLGQWFDRVCKNGFYRLFVRLASNVVGQISTSLLARILVVRSVIPQPLLKFVHRRIIQPLSIVFRSLLRHPLTKTSILSVERLSVKEPYYDLQVLDNNNYVSVDGTIHHNSGKTWVGCMAQCLHFWSNPKVNQGYFAPTYPQIRDIYYPTIEEVSHDMGLKVDIKEGNKEVHFYSGRQYRGTTICRSMERPETIIGFKIGKALVDELDVMKVDKARTAWNKVIARLRWIGASNGIDVTTTPEGFKFVYQRFKENPTSRYGIIQASTYDNAANLPEDYIPSLLESYPDELIAAYLNGQFVNLTSGTVYNAYRRIQHLSWQIIQPGEPLRIGMDFNVTNMSAVVYVMRGKDLKEWHAVDELKQVYDTPSIIEMIKERYPGHSIRIYPDASGGSRKTVDASKSDLSLLESAGFVVYANRSNPLVRDRVIATNQAFSKGLLYINDAKCPEYAKCMEQLAYDMNGEPDKHSNLDHLPDAGTYPIAFEMPVVKPATRIKVTYAR